MTGEFVAPAFPPDEDAPAKDGTEGTDDHAAEYQTHRETGTQYRGQRSQPKHAAGEQRQSAHPRRRGVGDAAPARSELLALAVEIHVQRMDDVRLGIALLE